MERFIRENSISIVIGMLTLASTFSLYGYRINALEASEKSNSDAIAALNTNNLQIQVALATIQTDIEYIKTQIAEIPR